MLEASGVGPPVPIDLDEELQEHLFLEEFFDILACQGAYPLQRCTGLADDDAFLAIPFAVDDRRDANDILFFLERLHFDLHGVWDLLVITLQDLLPDDLIDKEPFGFIGQLILGEEGFAFR